MKRRRAGGVVVAAALLTMAGCSDDNGGDAEQEGPSAPCVELLQQVTYETARQLAAGGHAADPDALRDAAPTDHPFGGTGRAVELPDYPRFTEDYSDAEQAEVKAALTSQQTGIGAVVNIQGLLKQIDVDEGPCEGWETADW